MKVGILAIFLLGIVVCHSKKKATPDVLDNEEVFCTWRDVVARDNMARILGTQNCRFSMVFIFFFSLNM